jgi:hypothetical protein
MDAMQLKKAGLIVWLILSAFVGGILLSPHIFSAKKIEKISAYLSLPRSRIHECTLCGITSGFLLISSGDFWKANSANRGALPLYLTFVLNEVLALGYLWRTIITRKSLHPV